MRDTNYRYYVGPECQGHYGDELWRARRDKVTVAVVAEKGAREEVRLGRPLIGDTGQKTREHLREAGIPLEEIWLTNSVHNFNDPDANPVRPDVEREQPRLLKELADLPNLNVIICLGQHALDSLGGFHYAGITKWRGSILRSIMGIKMVPTFHPSFYTHGEWRYRPVVQFDINRAAQERITRILALPTPLLHVEPTYEQALEWLDYLEDDSDSYTIRGRPLLMFDLETFRSVLGRPGAQYEQWFMSCFGAAKSGEEGFCIPFMRRDRSSYWSPDREATLRLKIQQLLLSPGKCFGTQGGVTADCWWLRREGIITPHMARGFDTMYAHRLLAPDLPHALHFLSSLYTRFPYYKDESGKNEKAPVSDAQYWRYNCKDTTSQSLVARGIENDLHELDMAKFFYEEIQGQWDVVSDMIERGFRVDHTLRLQTQARLQGEVQVLEQQLQQMIGWNPNPRSRLDMAKLLESFGVNNLRKTDKGNIKAGEDDLLHYANVSSNPSFKPVTAQLIEIKSRKTLLSNFVDLHTDEWGYYHALYDIAHAKTIRLSSSGDGQGPQLQNVPLQLRNIWVPDPGCVLTISDYKQAEAMVVAWDAQDYYLMEAFEKGYNLHEVRGCSIYRDWYPGDGLPPDSLRESIKRICVKCLNDGNVDCTHSEYFISKVSGHAFAYLLGVRKYINHVLLPAGVFMTEREAKRIRSRVVSKAIEKWQNLGERELRSSAWATNAFGMKREFYGYIDQDMVRALLSWKAQSVIACLTNRAMRLFHERLKQDGHLAYIRVVNQMHDSLAISHPLEYSDYVSGLLDEVCKYKLFFHGRPLVIPIDKKRNVPNWRGK